MNIQLLQKIVQKATNKQDLNWQIVDIFNFVRDIPYGDIWSRNPEDVYFNNKGTCSWKHELLKSLYLFIWVEVKECVIIHHFRNLSVDFPEEIKLILDSEDILDPHNLLMIRLDEDWIKVDCTWDLPMKLLWFQVNENRDGKSDQKICVIQEWEIMELNNAIKFKEDFINDLSILQREKRKLFLKKFTEWLDVWRNTN